MYPYENIQISNFQHLMLPTYLQIIVLCFIYILNSMPRNLGCVIETHFLSPRS